MATKQTTFRLTVADRAILNEIKKRRALPKNSDALRHALREWAKQEGIEVTTRGIKRG